MTVASPRVGLVWYEGIYKVACIGVVIGLWKWVL